jgi:hypothetical protein
MQSAFSAGFLSTGRHGLSKATQVTREVIHMICASSCFVCRIELVSACKKCSLLADTFHIYYLYKIHLLLGNNTAENYVKHVPLKDWYVKAIYRILEK